MVSEFSAIIIVDASYRELDLEFYLFDEVDENLQCFGFESEEEYPSEASEVINYNQYIFFYDGDWLRLMDRRDQCGEVQVVQI